MRSLSFAFTILFISCVTILAKKGKARDGMKTCLVKSFCGKNQSSELASWDCFGEELYQPTADPLNEQYVEHDCGGVGWGNSIRGLFNAAALAAVLNRRLMIRFTGMEKLWLPPYGAESWDFGVDKRLKRKNRIIYNERDMWDFEAYGRAPNRFGSWVKSLGESKDKATQYSKLMMTAGICGGERDIFVSGNCMTKVFPLFGKCATSDDQAGYMSEQMLLIPVFYSTFSKPSPLLVSNLNNIRDRLSLPQLEPGFEPFPGAWGLQTPGYYILAMHFRRVPLGFEPLSVELNEERNRQWRLDILRAFWDHVTKSARQAKKIAKCRGQQLLIYFATDNIRDLRPEATSRLSKFGRVVFGLADNEVGHISPQWMPRTLDELQQKAVELQKQGIVGVGGSEQLRLKSPESTAETNPGLAGESSSVQSDVAISGEQKTLQTTDLLNKDANSNLQVLAELGLLVNVNKTDEAVSLHGQMALVEWWILGNANWLISHSGTSFSDTSAAWGLGPRGRMERLDIVHGHNHYYTAFRREWESNPCKAVGAADREHAIHCPNSR